MPAKKRSPAKEAHYRRLLADQREDETLAALARRRGVVYQTLVWWRRELARRDAEGAKDAEDEQLLPVRMTGVPGLQPEPAGYEVLLLSGRRLHVPGRFDPQSLRALVAVLEEQP